MTTQRQDISGQLLDLDRPAAGADRAEYERRLQTLFDRKLTPGDWAGLALMGVGGLAGASVCGMLAATEPAGMPAHTRFALAAMALIGLSWTALAGVVMRRGSINSAVHGAIGAKLGFVFTLAATAAIAVLSLAGAGRAGGAGLVLLPAVPLVLAAVVLIVHTVRQAELRLRRDMLEIEYRLARLAEAGGAK